MKNHDKDADLNTIFKIGVALIGIVAIALLTGVAALAWFILA